MNFNDLPDELKTKARNIERHSFSMNRKSDREIAGDLIAGLLLTQILYWSGHAGRSQSKKATISYNGRSWIAKRRTDWEEEIGITSYQYDRAINILIKKNLIVKELFKFGDTPMHHLSVNYDVYESEYNKWLYEQVKDELLDHESDFGENPKSDFGENQKTDFRQNHKTDFGENQKTDFRQNPKTDFGQNQKSLYTETTTEITSETTTYTTPKRDSGKFLDESFEQFWKLYPRKVNKSKAKEIWLKLKPEGELLEEIMEAVRKQSMTPAWRKDGGQFVPYPTTWLRGKRWEDEVEGSVAVDPKEKANSEIWHKKTEDMLKKFAETGEFW